MASLAFVLILFLGSIAGAACFIILSEANQSLVDYRMATTALGGMGLLLALFCAYITQTRITFGKMRAKLEQAFYDLLTGLYNR